MISLDELNAQSPRDFLAALDGIFEHSAWVAERVAALRPFTSRLQLLDAMRAAVHSAPLSEQLSLIRAHPKLGNRGRNRSALTPASAGEQKRAGLDACSDEEFERLQRLNDVYEEKFSFPFILAVRGHDPPSIIENIESRLGLDPAHERRTALREIGLIAEYRLAEAIATAPGIEVAAMRERLVRCHVAATDVGSERTALVREWMLAAGGEVSSDGILLLGRFRGVSAAARLVAIGFRQPSNLGALFYEEPMSCLLGLAVIQQFRQSGIDMRCELQIAATPSLLARCADDPRTVRDLDLAARRLADFLLQHRSTTGPTTSVFRHD